MKYAVSPRGPGKPVGYRAVEEGWPLAADEAFFVTEDPAGKLLAANGTSLRQKEAGEVLEAARAVRRTVITGARTEALRELTATHDGAEFNADDESANRMAGAIAMWERATMAGDPRAPKTVGWLDAANGEHALTLQGLIELASAVWLAQQLVWQRNHAAKVAIEAASTPEAIEAVEF